MKKLYSINCSKYRKFGKPKILHLLKNTISFYYLEEYVQKWRWKNIKQQEWFEILKIPGLNNDIEEYGKNIIMPEENINQEFRLNKIDEIRNYLMEVINSNELMSKKHKIIAEFRIVLTTIWPLLFWAP